MQRISVFPFPSTALAIFLAACSAPPSSSTEPSRTPPPPIAGRGSIEGSVRFQGSPIPASTRVRNTTDPDTCGTVQSLQDRIISRENQGIKNVILGLDGVVLPQDYQPETSRLVIDNKDCQFEPHVAVLTTGSSVEATNSDSITHTVHVYGFLNRNLALGPNQSKLAWTFRRPGYYIVKCDLHGWMQAFFRVDHHPYHAVSDRNGEFQIRNVPLGRYRLEAWHEYFGERQLEVEVKADVATPVAIVYRDKTIE